ncbi:arginine-glutamic acid dipeptide repeats protein-like isoform X1 [Hibiscus syriacus]|uniref:arginine-glutamic acid dipeptide repeats protein-like isoform X1 n=1 Tax=Hibiscus syriacus TaxID=106335 RepID=UPI00192332AB|nr:arginine-glutamic acid dipeptide repeats protein-like isoform X1 [Hibiscus syriacus]XP_039013112.1 arginine-glutamic acid dipeptide repeats protein-like isoform X1 [Hibiscus syriacus]
MASGFSGRGNSGGSKGFDFGSDDILCSYEDYGNQGLSNGNHAETAIGTTTSSSSKDFHKGGVARSMFPRIAYSQPDDSYLDVTATVDKTMKKYADNLMRFLVGISSRLSQLELYCYNLDKSIGEMRSDLVRDNVDADSKLKSIEKHLQEVHRSVQILRDKQELAETQKELAKLQLVHKDFTSSNYSQSAEERASPPASDSKKSDHITEMQSQQLALALPHQVAPPQQSVVPHTQAPAQNLTQQSYYLPSNQLSNPPAPTPALTPVTQPSLPAPAPTQHTQSRYLPPDQQYQTSHIQTHQVPPAPTFPRYPQQWPQQLPPQQVQQQQQPSMQPPMRPPSTTAYPPYPPTQSSNPTPPEALPRSIPMQVPYSGVPQPVPSRADTIPYGYGVPGRTPPEQIKCNFEAQPRDGYQACGLHPSLPPGTTYMMYGSEGSRTHHLSQQHHFSQGGYPPASVPLQTQPSIRNPGHPQYVHNHPYNDLIEKLASMGFRGEHVASVIQRMEESGQPVDFNAVLDRLNAHSSGGGS